VTVFDRKGLEGAACEYYTLSRREFDRDEYQPFA
jgi:hypothetical protein